ncbi:MAG: hypothetical protein ACFCU3_04815 [Verrucomicrobiales bacterium]
MITKTPAHSSVFSLQNVCVLPLLVALGFFTCPLSAQAEVTPEEATEPVEAVPSELSEVTEVETVDTETAETAETADATSEGAEAAQPAEDELPPMIYFTTQRISVPIEGGLQGIAPGTMVRLIIKPEHGNWEVSDGELSFEIDPMLLTRDINLAQQLQARDQAAQSIGMMQRARLLQSETQREFDQRQQHSENVIQNPVRERTGLSGESRLNEPTR